MYGSSLKKQTTIKPVQAIGGLHRRLGLRGVPEEELGGTITEGTHPHSGREARTYLTWLTSATLS